MKFFPMNILLSLELTTKLTSIVATNQTLFLAEALLLSYTQ